LANYTKISRLSQSGKKKYISKAATHNLSTRYKQKKSFFSYLCGKNIILHVDNWLLEWMKHLFFHSSNLILETKV